MSEYEIRRKKLEKRKIADRKKYFTMGNSQHFKLIKYAVVKRDYGAGRAR